MEQIKNAIQNGKTVLGIELGSTRIKAVLIVSPMEMEATKPTAMHAPTSQ